MILGTVRCRFCVFDSLNRLQLVKSFWATAMPSAVGRWVIKCSPNEDHESPPSDFVADFAILSERAWASELKGNSSSFESAW